ncbi:MAG: zinc ribbon domain-containing protein, partial [Candidatus Eremiobacteraeota bacterium]|nr:zinc ribbon domain-containing protein [Candidatus Eremiobacteraeota bacterium]
KIHRAFLMSIRNLEGSPLSKEFKEQIFPSIRKKLKEQDRLLANLLAQPELIEEYKALSIGIKHDFEAIRNELKLSLGGLELANDYENMRSLIIGRQSDRVPLRYFRQILGQFEEILNNALATEEDETACRALQEQKEGLEELKLYLEDSNKEHLVEGWRMIDSGVRVIIGMKPQQASEGITRTMIPCIKCGTLNMPEVQYCINCGAFIPFAKMIASEREGFSVKEGEEGRPESIMAKNISILHDLVQRLENNQASIEEFETIVGDLRRQAQDTRTHFENKILPNLTTDEDKNNCLNFIETVKEFEGGLERMLAFSSQRNFSNLIQGFSQVSTAADKLALFV